MCRVFAHDPLLFQAVALPANFLFLNNFVPFGGAMGWTWSLAVQVSWCFLLIEFQCASTVDWRTFSSH